MNAAAIGEGKVPAADQGALAYPGEHQLKVGTPVSSLAPCLAGVGKAWSA